MSGLTPSQKVAHLIRRATFGETAASLAQRVKQGWDATLYAIVHYESVPDPLASRLGAVEPDLINPAVLHDAQVWWAYRLRHSPRPLEEKMTLFWHGHFATAAYKVRPVPLMLRQNALFRRYATGNFLSLLLEVYKDPAMLIWLDGVKNRRGAPNENFARECMELFTIGIGHFTQKDVVEGSRALTGWVLKNGTTPELVPRLHDNGVKTFLGQTGRFNGGDIMRILAGRPETGQFLAKKLWAFFADQNPDPAVIDHLAGVYFQNHYEIKPVLQALFSHPAFYAAPSVLGHIKSPVEYVMGALRQLDAQYSLERVPAFLQAMGQELFNPPNVGGWPGGPAWINADTLHRRSDFAQSLLRPVPGSSGPVNLNGMVAGFQVDSGAALAAKLGDFLLAPQLGDNTRATLARAVRGLDLTGPQKRWEAGVRGLIHLALVAPEYQLG